MALVRGLGNPDEDSLRELYLAIGRSIGGVEITYGVFYDVIDSGGSYLERSRWGVAPGWSPWWRCMTIRPSTTPLCCNA